MIGIFSIDLSFYSDEPNASDDSNAQEKMDDEVVKSNIKALKKDDKSKVHLLKTNIWEIKFEGSTPTKWVVEGDLQNILAQVCPGDQTITTFLRDQISTFTSALPEPLVMEQIFRNTLYSKKHIDQHTRLSDIPKDDLREIVMNVMAACNRLHPWYRMWDLCRDIARIYSPFDPTLFPEYFQAKDPKDMLAVALNISGVQPAPPAVCPRDDRTHCYYIRFFPLSDLLDHKFDIKTSSRYDKFITYDGATIRLRTLTLYDIQVLKYLIKHFKCDASRSIYQLLASMMMSEKDVKLAHDIGWFSGISWNVFVEAHQKDYLISCAMCERTAFLAMESITKDYNNLLKGFVRDFKYQSSTSPANIWIAVTSLIFALVSVIQFFMSL
ncbi:hypothetical protein BGZ47_003512 [Haplosporangium gracile]|nr:hypothetical protein BGZ47_003512 [Haplosporangium gracile]